MAETTSRSDMMTARIGAALAMIVALTSGAARGAAAQGGARESNGHSASAVRLTYLGTAGWEISDGHIVVLVDPYLTRLPRSAFGSWVETRDGIPLAMLGERRRGNAHAADVAYVFGKVDGAGYEAVDRALSDVMQKYWTNFAKTGNPNGPGVPPWPSFDPTSRAYVAFTAEGAVVKNGLRRPFCDLFLENTRP